MNIFLIVDIRYWTLFDTNVVLVSSSIFLYVHCSRFSKVSNFRSKDDLYNSKKFKQFNLKNNQEVFTLSKYLEDPRPFCSASELIMPKKKHKPTPAHHLMKYLSDRGQLSRVYTQNIDGLEKGIIVNYNLKTL